MHKTFESRYYRTKFDFDDDDNNPLLALILVLAVLFIWLASR